MNTLVDVIKDIWPMLLIFTVIISTVRIAYLIGNKEKILLYKEFFMLIFILYVLVLFYIVTFQDSGHGTSNYVPFKEIFRYNLGSPLFIKNVIGNMLLFIPFGLFVSYYINNHRMLPIFIISLISSVSIEFTQSKIGRVFDIDDIILNVCGGVIGYLIFVSLDTIERHLPRIFRTNWFRNFVVLVIIALITLYFLKIDTAIFHKIS